jgi:hypothetical protein
MAKSSKKSKAPLAQETPSAVPPNETRNGNGLSQLEQVAPKAKGMKAVKGTMAPKSAVKNSESAPRKTAAKRTGRLGKSTGSAARPDVSISDDEIRLRAYFLSERRMREGLPGDSGHDWLEARRQLMAEAQARS